MAQVVAIVGRPNVGKSTLFNRLIGQRRAIVDDESGVTRDRLYGFSHWNGKQFTVVDTGGFVHGSDDVFEASIRSQVHIAIDEAEVIIFMVDVATGITDLDEEVARMLRKGNKPVIVAVNKVDNSNRALMANEFWSLGFDDTFFLSSISGSGTGELLDRLVEVLPTEDDPGLDESLPRIAIVGQPNVGKSSMTNALLDQDRNIVTDIPGTTRDSIYTKYNKFGNEFYLIDTAGIRKKNKVHEDLEFYSVIRAVKSIDEADVCILMIDATHGLEQQDLNIIGLIQKRRKGLVLVVNKWDLMDKETNTARDYEQALKDRIGEFTDFQVIFTSVVEKQRIFKTVEAAMQVHKNRKQKISTSKLNDWLQETLAINPPPMHRGRMIKIKYMTQLPLYYPSFAFFCNHPKHVKQSYKGYLENRLREKFNLTGVPIGIQFRDK